MQQDPNDPALQKDPETWKSKGDPATPAQRSYLDTLAQQAGEPTPPDNLTKAQASEKIDELQAKVPGAGQSYDIEPGDDPNLHGDDDAHSA